MSQVERRSHFVFLFHATKVLRAPTETPVLIARSEITSLLVQDNAQEGIVDLDLAVVSNEAQFPELVHEQIDS